MREPKLCIVVRRDLHLGRLAAQLVHAAVDIASEKDWLPETVAVLTVESEERLLALNRRLDNDGIETFVVLEPDLDWEATAMAVVHVAHPALVALPLLFEGTADELNDQEKTK